MWCINSTINTHRSHTILGSTASPTFEFVVSGTSQGNVIRDTIGTLAVNCTPVSACWHDDGKCVTETASHKMILGAVWTLPAFSLFVSQQIHPDPSLQGQDDTRKWFYEKKGAFQNQTRLRLAKAKVHEQLPRELQRFRDCKIHKTHGPMGVLVYGTEKNTTTQWRPFQVYRLWVK